MSDAAEEIFVISCFHTNGYGYYPVWQAIFGLFILKLITKRLFDSKSISFVKHKSLLDHVKSSMRKKNAARVDNIKKCIGNILVSGNAGACTEEELLLFLINVWIKAAWFFNL